MQSDWAPVDMHRLARFVRVNPRGAIAQLAAVGQACGETDSPALVRIRTPKQRLHQCFVADFARARADHVTFARHAPRPRIRGNATTWSGFRSSAHVWTSDENCSAVPSRDEDRIPAPAPSPHRKSPGPVCRALKARAQDQTQPGASTSRRFIAFAGELYSSGTRHQGGG